MRGGPAVLCGLLLGLCLIVAHFIWTGHSRPTSDKNLIVLDVKPDAITAVRLATASKTVELVRTESEWWVTVADRPSLPRATDRHDAEVSQTAVTEAGPSLRTVNEPGVRSDRLESAPREFRANRLARALVARFAPLEAVRDLGPVSDQRMEEFGLESPNERLTVAYEGGEESFDVGRHVTEGSQVYLRRRSDRRAYVVRADPLSKLEDSEGLLLDRRLHGFAFADIDRAVVRAGDRRLELVRKTADNAASFWVDADAPEQRNELYERWLRQAHQLDVEEFLPAEAGAAPGTPLVTIEYYRGAAKQGQVELRWRPAEQGVSRRFRARSEHTLRWARVAGAEALARDLDDVLPP